LQALKACVLGCGGVFGCERVSCHLVHIQHKRSLDLTAELPAELCLRVGPHGRAAQAAAEQPLGAHQAEAEASGALQQQLANQLQTPLHHGQAGRWQWRGATVGWRHTRSLSKDIIHQPCGKRGREVGRLATRS
jgi:hypothetical protein